jgi:hypothetical protein
MGSVAYEFDIPWVITRFMECCVGDLKACLKGPMISNPFLEFLRDGLVGYHLIIKTRP